MLRIGFGRTVGRLIARTFPLPGLVIDSCIPQRCLLCSGTIAGGQAFCRGCEEELPYNTACCARCAANIPAGELCGNCLRTSPPFGSAFCPLLYRYPLDHLITQLKYAQDPATGRLLGKFMAEELLATHSLPLPEALVPIPLHPNRLRERSYNQAMEICRSLAKETGIPIESSLISRQKSGPPQVGLSRRDREQNMRNAFRLEQSLRFTHYALVDDVITSGATMCSAAQTLCTGGACRIEIWSLARA